MKRTATPDGIIRFEADKVSEMVSPFDYGRHSPEVIVRGMPWQTSVFYDSPDLLVELMCLHEQSTHSTIDVESEFIIVNSDPSKNRISKSSNTFHMEKKDYGCRRENIINWEELINEENGFLKDDKITVEVRFWINNIRGIRADPRVDFSDPNVPFHDITLIIGGKKIYVSKQILASQSPFFFSLFYGEGEFSEKNKDEIELRDMNPEEFIELLYVIYPSCKQITEESAEYLLHLADRFQIVSVTERSEKFLLASDDFYFPIAKKLLFADRYNLAGLRKHSLSALKTTQDFKDVQDSSDYSDLSLEMKATLFECILKVAK